jgi:hypothetical protein
MRNDMRKNKEMLKLKNRIDLGARFKVLIWGIRCRGKIVASVKGAKRYNFPRIWGYLEQMSVKIKKIVL